MLYLGTTPSFLRDHSQPRSQLSSGNMQEILNEEQVNETRKILTWLREGVRIEEFLKHFSKGRFHGQKYESKYPNSRKFANFVRPEHTEWVDREIHKLLSYGAIKTWKECGLEGDPVIVAPLQVEVETTKNRLIYNAHSS